MMLLLLLMMMMMMMRKCHINNHIHRICRTMTTTTGANHPHPLWAMVSEFRIIDIIISIISFIIFIQMTTMMTMIPKYGRRSTTTSSVLTTICYHHHQLYQCMISHLLFWPRMRMTIEMLLLAQGCLIIPHLLVPVLDTVSSNYQL